MFRDQPVAHARPCTLHRTHPTTVAFFDETGAIASDRFFTVGLLRVDDHASLLKQVKALRKQEKFHEEFKWSGITESNKDVYKKLFDLLVKSEAKFSCFVADRHVADPVARFGNTFAAYEKLATQLLIGSVAPYELVSVLADNYSAPNDRSFENTVKRECNRRLRRLGVVSVVQVDSGATAGLQLVDVLTGAVGFEFKANAGQALHTSHKGEVAAYVRGLCGAATFNTGFVTEGFKVKLYEHRRWLTREQEKVARLQEGVQASISKRGTRRGRRGGRRSSGRTGS